MKTMKTKANKATSSSGWVIRNKSTNAIAAFASSRSAAEAIRNAYQDPADYAYPVKAKFAIIA